MGVVRNVNESWVNWQTQVSGNSGRDGLRSVAQLLNHSSAVADDCKQQEAMCTTLACITRSSHCCLGNRACAAQGVVRLCVA
jgi:hypothetical protein